MQLAVHHAAMSALNGNQIGMAFCHLHKHLMHKRKSHVAPINLCYEISAMKPACEVEASAERGFGPESEISGLICYEKIKRSFTVSLSVLWSKTGRKFLE